MRDGPTSVMMAVFHHHPIAGGLAPPDALRAAQQFRRHVVGIAEDAALSHANDAALFADETDPVTGEALDNFPQAFSHIDLINAAHAIRDAGQQPPPQGAEHQPPA
ncbi:glycoside hydrolase family 15 protein [Streptomyces sp. NPDC039016]|uniref:glycoside hydrolase family 15 protein n=1 Tax=Streptomyces sp. NPDC039016 TaxID=3154330 RepID=UPI003407F6F2